MGNVKKSNWKKRVFTEMRSYLINVAYLAIFFGIFAWHRRLILAQHEISYLNYGISLIEALIFGKIVMIGDLLGLGRRLDKKPLIIVTFYKAAVFTILVFFFSVIEYGIRGLIGGKGVTGGIIDLINKDKYEIISRNLVIFFAFIPFFAFKELERVLGEKTVSRLFFRKR